MKGTELPLVPQGTPAGPSRDALRLIVSGTAYLLAVAGLQLSVTLGGLFRGTDALTGHLMDVRDVVALFGWVGLMISGVAVIIVPNHLKVPLRPAFLPQMHLVLANAGLVSFFVTTLVRPASSVQDACLALVSLSYLLFGLGIVATIVPFLRPRVPQTLADRASAGRPSSRGQTSP